MATQILIIRSKKANATSKKTRQERDLTRKNTWTETKTRIDDTP